MLRFLPIIFALVVTGCATAAAPLVEPWDPVVGPTHEESPDHGEHWTISTTGTELNVATWAPLLDAEMERLAGIDNGGMIRRWNRRLARYDGVIEEALRSHNVPMDLRYVAMIESGGIPTAVSPMGAVGLWQFMEPTARDMGLRIDRYVDERRDPVAASFAAARYLRFLYEQLDSWPLAVAAYNGGVGRIGRLVDETGLDDPYRLAAAGVLPSETAAFTPRVLAARNLSIGKGYASSAVSPLSYDTITVREMRLEVVAEDFGVDVEEVLRLNPHLVRRKTPPMEDFSVRVPSANPTVVWNRRSDYANPVVASSEPLASAGESDLLERLQAAIESAPPSRGESADQAHDGRQG